LANNPLKSGEKLNLIGYSGGGQVALNVAQNLEGRYKVDHVVTLGSPIMPLDKSNINRTTHIVSERDIFMRVWNLTTKHDPSSQKIIYPDASNVTHSGNSSYLSHSNVIKKVAKVVK